MKVIGITGGIGTGKSTILEILMNQYRAMTIEADKVAHILMEPGQVVYDKIVYTFGRKILGQDGYIQRDILGKIVFSDPVKLRQLNMIVHPAVKEYIQQKIQEYHRNGMCQYMIIEAALLLEDGYDSICDEIWYVYSDKETRILRLIQSRGYSRAHCEKIIANQSEEENYREQCDYVIDNSGDLSIAMKQIYELLK